MMVLLPRPRVGLCQGGDPPVMQVPLLVVSPGEDAAKGNGTGPSCKLSRPSGVEGRVTPGVRDHQTAGATLITNC